MPPIKIPFLYRGYYKKTVVHPSKTEYLSSKADAKREGITIFVAWHRRYGKGKQQASESTPKSTHDVKLSEQAIYNKTLRGYPNDCHDMFTVEGAPLLRRCVCPMRDRPVDLPQKNDMFIVDDPKICWRCRARGFRKDIKQPKPKLKSEKKPKRQSYGRRQVNWGNSEGLPPNYNPYYQ